MFQGYVEKFFESPFCTGFVMGKFLPWEFAARDWDGFVYLKMSKQMNNEQKPWFF